MVSISHESSEATGRRLRAVLAQAEMTLLPGVWAFAESPAEHPPSLDRDTLAVVQDGDSWSALRRSDDDADDDAERFGLLSFHFPDGVDDSGFVGWLATELKARLGTGVFVVCGSNRSRGGIYDYWGFPAHLADEVVATVRSLAGGAQAETGEEGAGRHAVDTASIHALVPLAAHLQVAFETLEPDVVVASLPDRPEHGTIGGGVHGGALMALADVAAAVCAVLASGDAAATPATVQSSTNFLRRARGRVTATARPVRRGSSSVVDVELTDDEGALCAVVRQVVSVRAPRP